MRVLLLGVGMQGKAALHDLLRSAPVTEIIAADRDLDALRAHISGLPGQARLRCETVEATDRESLDRLFCEKPDVAIDLMPPASTGNVARSAIEHGVHLVNTSYVNAEVLALADEAAARGVTILPEFGMDPGIDLVLMAEAVRTLDTVESLRCYGGGIPEPAAAGNPLQYKITWTMEGVLRSYHRPARLVRNGRVIEIGADRIFAPENLHALEIAGLGTLEAIPNGDALKYAPLLGLDPGRLRELGRFTLRYPGHSAFWKKIAELHLLDDEPVLVDGVAVDRRRYLATALAPHLGYADDERDVAIIRIEADGVKDGHPARAVGEVIDRRDLTTGLTAMNRTVGFTASIGAQMITNGTITRRGLLSPVNDVPFAAFVEEAARRGIHLRMERSGEETHA
jgi:lysine 6-dehydrogenase